MRASLLRLLALIAVLAMTAVACGGGETADVADDEATEDESAETEDDATEDEATEDDATEDMASEDDMASDGPVEFTLWYPADRYTNQAAVAEIIARSLNESGMFNVTTDTAEWATEYSTHLSDGAYGAYLLGWYPDYLDADDYIDPFYKTGGFIGFYSDEEMDQLIRDEQLETDPDARAEIFSTIQEKAATDVPFIPLYSEGQEAYFQDYVTGVDTTLGAAQQTWFYVLGLENDSDTLVFGTTERPSTIDPADVYEKFASDILFNTTNRLVEFDPETNQIGPGLAEDWEISEDGLTYTFNLRDGVVFHDGSDMTAEDVVWSINRSLNINHPDGASFLINSIESIEATDDSTVTITLSEANSTFLSRLNYTVGTILPSDSDVYRAPDAKLEASDDSDAASETLLEEAESFLTQDAIVGTGPYQMTDYQPGVSMTLEAFDGYWGEAPAIPTIRVQFFEDTTQMRNALAAGEIDLAVNDLDPTETASLEGEEGIEVISNPGGRTSYMVIDVTQEPFTDPAVRRTIAALIDRERIVEEAFEGQASPLFSMIPENFDESEDFFSALTPEL